MNKKYLLLILLSCFFFACTEDCLENGLKEAKNNSSEVSKVNLKQAEMYASIFSKYLDENDTPDEKKDVTTRAAKEKEIGKIDFLIEDGDTLIYAFNYKGDGFILIGADNASFPILAHAKEGSVSLSNINKNESGLSLFIETAKNNIKASLKNQQVLDSEYYENWKDLGKDGYEYEIIPSENEPVIETRARRENSSGKASIYPYTGKDLEYWDQVGGYNYFAKNKACIGCPAISISMLLYDCSERLTGCNTSTYPSFEFYDKRDITSVTTATETARKLREVADFAPNYQWGAYKDSPSGATPNDVLIGLRKIGFKNAQMGSYNLETLYNNLSFKEYNYFGQETTYYRGILIGAFANYPYSGGHIWFCDGYYEQSYTVRKKILGITVKTWTEYDDRLYMNWGAGVNGGNGWYCATDDIWTSLDHPSVHLKSDCKIYTNLNYYEYTNMY